MNYLIFGDVHGDAKALLDLLTRTRVEIGPDAHLTIYSVGDLIDRGPDSKGVIDLCIEWGVKLILGNHELWLHEWVTTGKVNGEIPYSNIMGGEATLGSYGIDFRNISDNEKLAEALNKKIPQSHREYLSSGVFWTEVNHGDTTYFLSHGGISQEAGSTLWNDPTVTYLRGSVSNPDRATNLHFTGMVFESMFRVAPQQSLWLGAKRGKVFRFPEGCVQVFGHTPWRGGAEISDYYVALDTGCGTCQPFKLSGLLLRQDGTRSILTGSSFKSKGGFYDLG